MKHFKVSKSTIQGQIGVPPSKSHTLRAILFGALAHGFTQITHYLPSQDSQAMIDACRLLGAKIEIRPNNCLEIQGLGGVLAPTEDVIDAGNSGIVLRFVAAIAALASNYTVITGDHSIRHQRPMHALLDALTQLGAFAVSTKGDGFAPIIIRGPMCKESAELNGKDSQPVSALLIASAFRDRPTKIHVKDPGEKPWIRLTLDWFDRLGIAYQNHDYISYEIPGNSSISGFNYTVPADFSSAAFPLAAAVATNSELTLQNIDMTDIQGDKEFITILQSMGACIEIDALAKTLAVKPGGSLKGMEIDINNCIDAVPILAVMACLAEGETRIVNAGVAREKECDRLHATTTELKKMGADITELADSLIVRGSPLKGASLHSHHDHRMAMALSVAALTAHEESTIDHADCVSKTFPHFAELFQSMGAKIEVFS